MIYLILAIGAALIGTVAMSFAAMASAADKKIKELQEREP